MAIDIMRFANYCRLLNKRADNESLRGYLNRLSMSVGWREYELEEGLGDRSKLLAELVELNEYKKEALTITELNGTHA